MASIKDARKLLKRLNYYVKVEKLDNGCYVTYPFGKCLYTILEDGFLVSKENNEIFLYNLPKIAIRLGVGLHIMRMCRNIKFHTSMIDYYVGDKRVKSIDSIFAPLDNKESEEKLCGLVYKIINGESLTFWFQAAKDLKLNNELKLLMEIWEEQ